MIRSLQCFKTKALPRPTFCLAARYNSTFDHNPLPPRQVTIDRDFPDPFADQKKNKRYFLLYAVGVTASCIVIFNYEKTRSPIINSVLYCLRRSDYAKASLGSNIGYQSSWPWIWGPLNTVQGKINIEFRIKGDQQSGTLKMKADRVSKLVPFDLQYIILVLDDGTEVNLLEDPSIDFDL